MNDLVVCRDDNQPIVDMGYEMPGGVDSGDEVRTDGRVDKAVHAFDLVCRTNLIVFPCIVECALVV